MTAANLPKTLYHYTDAAGLVGILRPEQPTETDSRPPAKLWASDVRYMNDSQELKFGADIFRKRLKSVLKEPSMDADIRIVLRKLAEWFDPENLFDWGLRCFATCFCRKGDLLSQWRGYGSFAIGFNREALANGSRYSIPEVENHGPFATVLSEVVYGKNNATAVIDSAIRAIIQGEALIGLRRTEDSIDARYLVLDLLRVISSVKHSAFKEEREWRLFATNDVFTNAKTRARGSGGTGLLVPYLEMAVNMPGANDTGTVPLLHEIVVGPGPEQAGQIAAARELLKSLGHNPDLVRPSKAPLRR
ncbi:MAG: DUF2971 domain-containing protein [Segniliparus sp.]|uniref:DUF2971 domain-containing protein n=1 Tax=Segniliparus sp. TaxID=2804064 RepID=UPI003F381657